MKHFLKVLLILFYCNANLQASSNNNFQEGYIISLKGDTTKGFLLKQISRNASEECVFKLNADSEPKSYLPGEIEGYRYLDGKYYISKEIKIDSITKKVVFLEFLIKGMANIYYYVDNDEHYYIEKSPNGILELTEKENRYFQEEIPGREGSHIYILPSRFKGKLLAVLQDCPDIANEIQNTRPNHASLIKLTKDYHEKMCNSESCIIYERGNTSLKVKFGILVGFSQNQYDFGGELISNYSSSYQIGAALKISNFLMFNEHLSAKINVLFENSKSYTLSLQDGTSYCTTTYNNVVYTFNKTNYGTNGFPYLPSMKIDLNVLDLKIPIILNYDFNIAPKTLYTLGIGFTNKMILSYNKNFQIKDFNDVWGKSLISMAGVIVTTGIEGNWLGKHTVFVNAAYEYLSTFFLKDNQFSLQMGMYF